MSQERRVEKLPRSTAVGRKPRRRLRTRWQISLRTLVTWSRPGIPSEYLPFVEEEARDDTRLELAQQHDDFDQMINYRMLR